MFIQEAGVAKVGANRRSLDVEDLIAYWESIST